MKTKLTLLASTAVLAVAIASPAQAAGDWYVGVFGGANWVEDHSFSVATTPTASADTLTWSTDADTGFIVGGAVGLSLNNVVKGLRAEVEVAYRDNQVDGVWTSNTGGPGVSTGTLDIDHSTFSVLANVWYDFSLGDVTPYVGGGIGWADSQLDGSYAGGVTGPFDFSDSGFAWQIGAGVNFDVSPNVKLGVGYRYFKGPDVTVGSLYAPNSTLADVDAGQHAALVSVTFGM
jgi:opacity protein-like surface antigen